MKINFKSIGKFISENRGMILYAIGTIATTIIGASYGINTSSSSPTIDISSRSFDFEVPLNAKQTAISSLVKTALNGGWSAKDDAIRQIYEITKSDADDYTRSYAIRALQKIADAGGWSAKNVAQKVITDLAKAGGNS